jgi:hypothetical protein
MTTQPTTDQSEIATLKARIATLEFWITREARAKLEMVVKHEQAARVVLGEIARLERLNEGERATIEDLSRYIDVLCDALEESTGQRYEVVIEEAREAIL